MNLWFRVCVFICFVGLAAAARGFAYFDGNFDIQRHFLPNTENLYDWKAYQLPLEWRRRWYTTPNGFQATTGSLSQELFYIQHDIKLQADLHKNFALLYTQAQEEFYKTAPIYQQIEARFGHRYYVSVLGFPYYQKKYENLGLAVSYNEPYTLKHLKLTYLNQLATYNTKNREDDRNQVTDDLNRTPMLFKFESRYRLFKRLDVILDLEQELEAVLLDAADGLEKSYHGHNHRGTLLWHLNDRWLLGLAFLRRLEARTHRSLTSPDPILVDQTIDRYYFDMFANVRLDAYDLTFGYLDSGFKNTIDAADPDRNYRMQLDSKQAYAKCQRGYNDWMKWFASLQVGTYDFEKTDKDDDAGYKLKAGLGIILFKAEMINFLVLTTWAVDSISEGQWDGGNMQLQFLF